VKESVLPADVASVYDEHAAFVWRSLRRLGVPEADTPDALQEVFVVVHRKLPDFEGRSSLPTWLFGICLRIARSRRRKASVRYERADGGVAAEQLPDEGETAEEQALHDEATRTLEAVLDTLPEEQRVVFVLFELEEMTAAAIAELLTIPAGTVMSRLRLAREGFRREVARRQARDRFEAPVREQGLEDSR
jgi:RNA polymerase sigma-70 factor, ECF subfamily